MSNVAPSGLDQLRWWTSLCLGTLVGLVVAGVLWVKWTRPSVPKITREQFVAARQRWQERGPENYDLTVKLSGRQSAEFMLQVRNGQVQSALRNGQPLKDRRTFDTWSVPGMFDTIGLDVDHVGRVADGTAPAGTPRLVLQGEFDATYGFPQRYMRTELDGAKSTAMWEVTEFKKILNP